VGEEVDEKAHDNGAQAGDAANAGIRQRSGQQATSSKNPPPTFNKSSLQQTAVDAYYGGKLYHKADGAEMVKDTDHGKCNAAH
jgi:hypothetical protein